ncbi:hypothetical protein QQX98_013298 [Neonectria punicea]|uniref:Uncharacterized protein n=1 Tax=Neonectria punicea TaxID=979145 RepID=A0ABR1GGS5_9HYPO
MQLQFDFEESRRDEDDYGENPSDDTYIAAKTLQRRDRVWNAWMQFAKGMGYESEATWVEFVLGSEDAFRRPKTFLKAFVKVSSKERIVLGPEEVKQVQKIVPK